jgi:hypothetical protein
MLYIQKFRCPVIFSACTEKSYTRVRERMNTAAGVSASHLLPHTTYDENLPYINTNNQEWKDREREVIAGGSRGGAARDMAGGEHRCNDTPWNLFSSFYIITALYLSVILIFHIKCTIVYSISVFGKGTGSVCKL